MAATKGANAENMTNNNPNEIKKFVRYSDPRVTVFTTDKVKKHYAVGTEVKLEKNKAEKWIKKGYATAEPVAGKGK